MGLSNRINITEVCPRDGWQNHKELIDTETKIEYIKKMIDCNPSAIEIASFVNPKAVPQMGDAAKVVAAINPYAEEKGVGVNVLALNKRGVDNAKQAACKCVIFGVSVSEEHNKRNVGKSIQDSFDNFKRAVEDAENMTLVLALPCVFGSPFGDTIDLDLVLRLCREAMEMGVNKFGLADTAGISTPKHTREVLQYLKSEINVEQMIMHLHDTRGMGLANAYVALEEGITNFESSLGAMGGCPFVPGAKGNIATEDLINMVKELGFETGYDLNKAVNLAAEMGEIINAEIISSMTRICVKQKINTR